MINPRVRALLDDLARLDPSLAKREAELIPVLEALLQARPEPEINQQFLTHLRNQLVTTPISMKETTSVSNPLRQKFFFTLAGAAIALVIAVPITSSLSQRSSSLPFSLPFSFTPTFTTTGDGSFGNLMGLNQAPALGSSVETMSSLRAGGMGGGMASPVANQAVDSDLKMATSEILIAPGEPYPYTSYTYVYKGELDLTDINNTVYRASGGLNLPNDVVRDLATTNLGPVDLGTLPGLEITSFNLKQESTNGYSVWADVPSGNISISANEGLWSAVNERGYEPLAATDIPSDEALIAVAEDFIQEMRIDTRAFGEPMVDRRGVEVAASQPESMRWYPDSLAVVYPLMLDGQPAMNGDGMPYGLNIMVNLRINKVSNANVVIASTYERSAYTLETDTQKILEVVKRGGMYGYSDPYATTVVEVELGTPEVILMNHSTYQDYAVENYFVPALKFPIIKNGDTSNMYQNAILIPLPQDILASLNQEPVYRIMDDMISNPAPTLLKAE